MTAYWIAQEKQTAGATFRTGKTARSEGKTNDSGGKSGKNRKKTKGKSWEIAWQPPIEHRILNRLDPEGCNNNTSDNNNQRSQYHAIHNIPYAFCE